MKSNEIIDEALLYPVRTLDRSTGLEMFRTGFADGAEDIKYTPIRSLIWGAIKGTTFGTVQFIFSGSLRSVDAFDRDQGIKMMEYVGAQWAVTLTAAVLAHYSTGGDAAASMLTFLTLKTGANAAFNVSVDAMHSTHALIDKIRNRQPA